MSAPLVEARLGRKPQDMLEAAVVLEAWAGVAPAQALDAGRFLMPKRPDEPLPSAAHLTAAAPRQRVSLEAAAFAASAIAVAVWAAPLRADIGGEALRRVLMVALPTALALQWTISSRYLSRPGGLTALRRRRLRLALGAVTLVAALGAGLGTDGVLAGLLTVAWTGGAILTRRGQPLLYAGAMAVATPPLLAGAPPVAVLAVLDCALALTFFLTPRPDLPGAPGPWERALRSGAIGAALGLLLISDRSVSWTSRPGEALLLVPSIVAGAWGGAHLLRLAREIPAALVGTGLHTRTSSRPWRIVGGALLRVVVACVTLSVLAAVAIPWPMTATARAGALAGFGLLALVTMLATLLESFGLSGRTLVAVVAGVVVEWLLPAPFAGGALVAGSGVAAAALLLMIAALLRRPATLLATTLWIT